MDPVDEQYSPYAYCANTPVNAIDPDGKEIYFFNKSDAFSAAYYLNDVNPGANISVKTITTQHTFKGGLKGWESTYNITKHVLSTENSDFNWSKNKWKMGLYDVINSRDMKFTGKFVDNEKMWNRGGQFKAKNGGGKFIVNKSGNRTDDPIGIVIMHEIVGHGHLAGGNKANQLNIDYRYDLDLEYYPYNDWGGLHGGYDDKVGWEETNLYNTDKKE